MDKEQVGYGLWKSSITPQTLAGYIRLNEVQWDSDGETLVWSEGRGDLVAQTGAQGPHELLGSGMRASGGLGYGGGEFTVANGIVYFAGPEGRLYRLPVTGGLPQPLTPSFGALSSPAVSPDGRWLVYIHQDEWVDGLALVDTEGKSWPRKLIYDTDFVMQPTWHPQGTHIAYIAWNQPNMPWDGAELRLATLKYDADGVPGVESVATLAGDTDTEVFQPQFSPDGRWLSYVSDETGWPQLYLLELPSGEHTQITSAEAEHSVPAWRYGLRVHGWAPNGRAIYFFRNQNNFFSLWRYDLNSGLEVQVEGLEDYTYLTQISVSPRGDRLALIASSTVQTERVITLELRDEPRVPPRLAPEDGAEPSISVIVDEPPQVRIHRRASPEQFKPEQLAQAQPITWIGHDGEPVYGMYFAPTNERYQGIGLPPLIIHAHGGPTSQARATFMGDVQFFATRGFAVLQVNYRGSTGYGRAYKLKHRGAWGLYDVEDCASGASHLVAQGLADPDKIVIMGGSAGGFAVLQSLVDKPGFYKAGVCLYGVSNQFTLTLESEFKFESRYSDMLLGSLPQAADLYRRYSPVFHADRIKDPVILFQGSADVVVPKAQSDSIVERLKANRVPHEYVVYEGEGHGWRKPESIEDYYKRALAFLQQYVLFA